MTIFAWNVPTLTVARFIAGCGMGAVLALVSLYVSEVSPRTRRGNLIARISLVATLLVGISSIVSLPILKALPSEGWRPLLGVGAVALLLIPLVNRRDIVESPRWLVQHKRLAEAEVLVRKFEKKARAESTSETTTFIEPTAIIDAGTKTPFRTLINSKLLVGRLLLMMVVWFLFYIGFFGVNTYLLKFLEESGVSNANALTIAALSRAAGIVAGIAVVFLIERIERRTLMIASMAILGIGMLLIILQLGTAVAVVGTILVGFGSLTIAPSLYTYTAEIFPTQVRATGTSIVDGIGHLGGAVTPFVIVPLLAIGSVPAGIATIVLMVMAIVLVAFGVRTNGRSLEEIAH